MMSALYKLIRPITKNQLLYKRAYGGDLIGDGTSYFDRSDFLSLDPLYLLESKGSSLKDTKRFKRVILTMKEYATKIKKSRDVYNINGLPITNIQLSKKPYNLSENINGLLWADKVLKAIEEKDKNSLSDLAAYGYALYSTKPIDATTLDKLLLLDDNIKLPFWPTALAVTSGVGAGALILGLSKYIMNKYT